MSDFDYARLVAKGLRRQRLRHKIAEALWIALVWAVIAVAFGTAASVYIRISQQQHQAHP